MKGNKIMAFDDVMGKEFSIQVPRDREYTSLEERNGWENQTFSSNDMPETIRCKCFGLTQYSSDGKIHPVCYSMDNLIKEFYLKGKEGFWYGMDELDFLCRFFCRQEGLYHIRSISKVDIPMIGYSDFFGTTFWLASHITNVYIGTFSLAMYASYNGEVCDDVLYYSYNYIRNCSHPIRPVFVLDSEVKLSESQMKDPEINWVKI